MRLLKTYPRGTAITAEIWNEMVEAINQRTPLPNNTIKLDETQAGFVLKAKPGAMMQPEINYSFKVGYSSDTLTIQDGYVNYLFNTSIPVEGYDGLTPETTYNIPTDVLRAIYSAREEDGDYEAVLFFRLNISDNNQGGSLYRVNEKHYDLLAIEDMTEEYTKSLTNSYQIMPVANLQVRSGSFKILQRQISDITLPMVSIASTPGDFDWRAANEIGV